MTFFLCSLINITIISLERLHATIRPFRHRFVKKRVYWIIIAVSYLIAVLISVLSRPISPSYSVKRPYDMMSSFTSACIFVIVFSYSVIFIKVTCSPQPRHHVVAGMERINSDAVLSSFCLATYVVAIYCTIISLVHNRNSFQVLSVALNLLGSNIIDTQLSCKSHTVCN